MSHISNQNRFFEMHTHLSPHLYVGPIWVWNGLL